MELSNMAPLNPTDRFVVTLEAQQWNAVLAALLEAPYRIAAPLVQAVSEQLHAQATPNGHDAVTSSSVSR
jgi:hypothetical protein